MTRRVVVRPGRGSDAPGLVAALRDHHDFPGLPADPVAAQRQVEALVPDPESLDRTLLVAEDGVGGIAGYAHWHVTYPLFLDGPSLYLTELFVREEHRGGGIGGALLDALHDAATSLRASRVELVQVVDTAAARRGFYEGHGYDLADHLRVLRRPGPR